MANSVLIHAGLLKYNPKDSHFFFFNQERSCWVRIPKKWCQLNAPGNYIRLMENISMHKAKCNAENLEAYQQTKSLYMEVLKDRVGYSKNRKELLRNLKKLLWYKGHLIGKTHHDIYYDILRDIPR